MSDQKKSDLAKFDKESYRESLRQAQEKAGIILSADQEEKSLRYVELLIEWNTKINLTALTAPDDVAIRHFLDCWTLLPFIDNFVKSSGKKNISLIDVGTGAGFPGLPIKILRPDIEITLLDSLNKRIKFLNDVIGELALKNISCKHGRAEDAAKSKVLREKYDLVTARAVAPLPVLCEYCLPFVKPGGYFIAMKGDLDESKELSLKAIGILGGTLEKQDRFTLSGTDMKRTLLYIKKTNKTPMQYPRKPGRPQEEPLF